MKRASTLDLLEEGVVSRIAARGSIRTFPPNAIIINEGDRTDSLYVILSGRVKVFAATPSGKAVVFGLHGAGEYIGELALDGGSRVASVVALESTRCSVIDADELREFIAECPEFAMHLIYKLIRKVRVASEKVKSLALMDAYGRIARLLLELSDAEEGRLMVRERLTHQDIGDRVGCSREMVSRILGDLVRGGYVSTEKGRIMINRKPPPAW